MSRSRKRRPPAWASPPPARRRARRAGPAGPARELARSDRRVPAARDRRVEEEDRENRCHRERDHEARGTRLASHGRKCRPATAAARSPAVESGGSYALAVRRSRRRARLRRASWRLCALGHAVPVLDAERAGRLLGQRVAVALAVRGADERGDDLEVPLRYVGGFTPEVGQAEVDVELEKIDAGRLCQHAPRVRTRRTESLRTRLPYASSPRTVKGSVQSSRDSPSIVRRHS